jgi:alanine dehydrogenase
MRIGVPKEIKNHEYRVGLTPESVAELTHQGHEVLVEKHAGAGIGDDDAEYRAAGAAIMPDAASVFAEADMIVKVKEPQAAERAMLRPGQIIFTYLHLAPDPDQTRDLVKSGAIAIAYETVTDASGGLPLLKPMSQVAGRMSIQAGATALEKAHGGRGVLLGGVPGVKPAKVVILGGGVVGFHAAENAVGLSADVTILDKSPAALERLSNHFGARARVIYSNKASIAEAVPPAEPLDRPGGKPDQREPEDASHEIEILREEVDRDRHY